MKIRTILLSSAGLLLMACATNPLTGKKQFSVIDEDSYLIPMAYTQYSDFLKESKVVTGTAQAQMVDRVGSKIKNAAIKWMRSKGMEDRLKNYKWDYNLIQNDQANAWCMPGGQIAVFTGIMPITKNETGLATVMGHEVAHALLSHGQQRVQGAMAQSAGGVAIGLATSESSAMTQQGLALAYGLGSNMGMLAYGRSHESEADRLGLILMAVAGYDPGEAIDFWQRMSSQTGGSSTPEFLSTHPSHGTRVNNIKKHIPEARNEAKKLGVR